MIPKITSFDFVSLPDLEFLFSTVYSEAQAKNSTFDMDFEKSKNT